YNNLRKAYQEQGDAEALETARALLKDQQSITLGDKERLYGYLEGGGKILLIEPQAMLGESPKLLGLDGSKMSKSNNNAIFLRDSAAVIEEKIRRMPTDPARVHRDDPGSPANCPVWSLHQLYSSNETCDWAQQGCRSAGIGCLECKAPLVEALQQELQPLQARAADYQDNPDLVRQILADGAERARSEARETLTEVRLALGLNYR
ncbi:MAG: tryptophan--tRNA ligase, partial [Gammaproteobacteria bacterium]|nr:tryptophan--tRNA ligase [Gammaproteobacteria bacterium]